MKRGGGGKKRRRRLKEEEDKGRNIPATVVSKGCHLAKAEMNTWQRPKYTKKIPR
jgi:hypothetical protein